MVKVKITVNFTINPQAFYYDGNVPCFAGDHLIIAIPSIFIFVLVVFIVPGFIILISFKRFKVIAEENPGVVSFSPGSLYVVISSHIIVVLKVPFAHIVEFIIIIVIAVNPFIVSLCIPDHTALYRCDHRWCCEAVPLVEWIWCHPQAHVHCCGHCIWLHLSWPCPGNYIMCLVIGWAWVSPTLLCSMLSFLCTVCTLVHTSQRVWPA